MNVVIVAGGLQTRFNELSCFPKILLPSKDGTPILIKQLDYFDEANTISIVVNKKFANIMKAYIEINHLNVDVIVSNNTNGSGNTLASVYDWLPKKNVLFFWSDILFDNDEFKLDRKIEDKDNCVIFTVNDAKYRYKIEDGKIVNRSFAYDGNVPGIFWIKDISEVIPTKPCDENKDLIDIIQEKVNDGMITFVESNINTKITEYKSLSEYKKIMSTSYQKDLVLPTDMEVSYTDKESMQYVAKTNEHLNYQYDWISFLSYNPGISDYAVDMPVSKTEDGYVCDMHNLEGYTHASKINLTNLLNNFVRYKVEVPLSYSVKFLLEEYNGKPLKGICDTRRLFENNITFTEIQTLIDNACNLLIDGLANDEWVLTHGNINSHNVLVNMTGDIKLYNPVSRRNGSFFCHPIVDQSEAYMVEIGLDDALRKEMTYKVDELPKIEDCDVFIETAIYLHLLGMLPIFAKDIMKLNIVFEYAISGLSNIINECTNGKK